MFHVEPSGWLAIAFVVPLLLLRVALGKRPLV